MTGKSDRPVFIVGCPRSGTTMLSLMLHAHPRLAMPPESRFLVSTWRKRHQFGDLHSADERRRLAETITARGSKVRDLGLKRRDVVDEIVAGPPTLGSAFGIVFQAFAREHGKPRWGDKRPRYYEEVDVLLRLFPDAQVIQVIRDGRANVASLKRMPWYPYDSVGAMAAWSLATHCAQRNQRRLPRDTFHVLQYEHLVVDPKRVLTDLCGFLDEEFDEAMLEPHRVAATVPERKTWHEQIRRGVNVSAVESWRNGLEPWELGLMETALKRKLTNHGYALSGAGARPTPGQRARYAKASAHRHIAAYRRWGEERRDMRKTSHPVAARLTSAQILAAGGR